MTRRGLTTADRRTTREDRRSGGRSVAERAFRQIRFIAVVLIVIVAAGYRPAAAGGPGVEGGMEGGRRRP